MATGVHPSEPELPNTPTVANEPPRSLVPTCLEAPPSDYFPLPRLPLELTRKPFRDWSYSTEDEIRQEVAWAELLAKLHDMRTRDEIHPASKLRWLDVQAQQAQAREQQEENERKETERQNQEAEREIVRQDGKE